MLLSINSGESWFTLNSENKENWIFSSTSSDYVRIWVVISIQSVANCIKILTMRFGQKVLDIHNTSDLVSPCMQRKYRYIYVSLSDCDFTRFSLNHVKLFTPSFGVIYDQIRSILSV